ncbi:MAG TPA: MBL fold metallo-hydrolase [Chitinophagales bacterium]|nr:MBL fold metallo-hydrolase [Chitinophagales bacterium]
MMTRIAVFVFNIFQENTYILYDETGECVIIDPGCSDKSEQNELIEFIGSQKLIPVKLINTHCHVDHIMGNAFVHEKFGLKPVMHREEVQVLQAAALYGGMFGVKVTPSPLPDEYVEDGDKVVFGKTEMEVLYTPGHSPGEVCLFCRKEKILIAGDVLFQMSIGRSDLPGGNYETLISSIKQKLLPLGDDVRVYPGHGPETTIGFEKRNNPFLA